MINREVVELTHKQIIIDLTIRTLERDRKYIGDFKMQRAFDMWFDSQIMKLHNDLKNIKAKLGKNGVKLQGSKPDGDFTVYIIVEKGMVSEKRYSNIALRNHCEVEIKQLLGLSGQN